jgi:organic radical activating enzyme
MRQVDVFRAWGRILQGRTPLLSLEITKECPLRCPGCYAYSPDHIAPGLNLRQLSDYRGEALVSAVLAAVRRVRPLHISIIGGEPLVRFRELGELLPRLDRMGIEVQLVTSAVREIPAEWASLRELHIAVSVDGLPPEHDRRRAPATYDRILKHVAAHRVIIHCTVTRQMMSRPDYLRDFCRFWSARPEARKIWFSIYTPQEGDTSAERLLPADRARLCDELALLGREFPKVDMPEAVVAGYRQPPASPAECVFARVTTSLSADLTTPITPCQFGGRPVCSECGCMASAGMSAIARYKLGGLVPLSSIFNASARIGRRLPQRPEFTESEAA